MKAAQVSSKDSVGAPSSDFNASKLQQIDWPGIRAAAVVIGVREAARQAAADLSPAEVKRFVNRVMQRSAREKWIAPFRDAHVKRIAQRGNTQAKPLSAIVSTGHSALANCLESDSKATRHDLSRGIRKAAAVVGERDGAMVLADSDNVRRIVSSASAIHGWEKDTPGKGVVSGLQAFAQQMVINVDARSQE